MHIPVEIILMILNYLPAQEQFQNYVALFGRKFAKREIQKKGVILYLGKKLSTKVVDILVHHRIKVIDERSFFQYSNKYENITTVILQVGLETIKSSAFYYCKNLKNINFPSSLKEIESSSFTFCNIEIIDLSLTKLEDISYSCFSYNKSKQIILPNTITTIYSNAFESNNIETIELPDSLSYLYNGVFIGCLNLNKIDLSNTKITVLNEECFKNCRKLEEIIFPENLVKIYDKCFMNTAVTHIQLPDSVNYLGKYAFGFCRLLTCVEFGKSLTKIDNGCFFECSNLKYVTSDICINLHSICDKAFMNNIVLEKFDFPQSLENIGSGAFRNTPALAQAILPRNLNIIGNTAFGWSGITKVFIPKTLVQLPYGVFRNTQITEVYIPKEIEYVSQDAFRDCLKLKYINKNKNKNI
jgi:hypothetical protein